MSVYGDRIEVVDGVETRVPVTAEWIDAKKPRTLLLTPAKVSAAVDELVAVGVQLRTAQRNDASYEVVSESGTAVIRVALDGDAVTGEVVLDASGAGSVNVSGAAAGTLTVDGVSFGGVLVTSETITIEVT